MNFQLQRHCFTVLKRKYNRANLLDQAGFAAAQSCDRFLRATLNFTPVPQGWNLSPKGNVCHQGWPLNSLEEWRGEHRISPPAYYFTTGGQLCPWGESLLLGANLRMGLWSPLMRNWRRCHKDILKPGPNPRTSIYNASVVKIYNATNSLACFERENSFSPI
jgi:hypothetical protein